MLSLYLLWSLILSSEIISCEPHDCNEALFEKADVSATSSVHDRDPKLAKLKGEHWWTASTSNYKQHIIFQFPADVQVIRIATQGSTLHDEYVSEYVVSYGSSSLDYVDYRSPSGSVKIFQSNMNARSIVQNDFHPPIVARWIRINPIRWKKRISMRIELYGCSYDSKYFHFDGVSLVKWNLKESPIASAVDSIIFRLKTDIANGVLLYSRGTQRDFIALQLKDNKLVLNVDLGSGILSTFSAGSLLDDGRWHDVNISRVSKDVVLSVDRVSTYGKIKGDFVTLNLNEILYIGGVPSKLTGVIVFQNFSGCIQNLYMNSVNMNKLIQETHYVENGNDLGETYKQLNILFSCPERSFKPVTFITDGSYVKLPGYHNVNYYNVSLSFRTFEDSGLLIHHTFSDKGYVKVFLENGLIFVHLTVGDDPMIKLQNFEKQFNDGKWHDIDMSIRPNKLTVIVDEHPVVTNRLLLIKSGLYTYIGEVVTVIADSCLGGSAGTRGFIGCMKMIRVNGIYKAPTDWKLYGEYCCQNEISFDTCHIVDRCNPNPCEHDGLCFQTSADFFCNCSNTDYRGAVCHAALKPPSCEAYQLRNAVESSRDMTIDVDGSGPLEPFPVTCQFHTNGRVVTVLHHRNEETTLVDGFQDAGSYVVNITYLANQNQIEALIKQSGNCWQHIRYDCFRSRIFNSPSQEGKFKPFSWWVSHYNQKMDFWGGAVSGSRKCECGMTEQCRNKSHWCNCDAGYYEWRVDEGDLIGKEYLPVKQLRFGDTGSKFDDRRGKYTLGPLQCEGNDLFTNVITFRKADATLELPTLNFEYSGDISFEFKTTHLEGILVECVGNGDRILIELTGGNVIRFVYQVDNKSMHVLGTASRSLTDNKWHFVFIEINRKELRVLVDGNEKLETRNHRDTMPALDLTSPLSVGGAVDFANANGFVGCMRAFAINGNRIDLVSYAKQFPYGLSVGCVGKCSSNPCLNNGTCTERYDSYVCECRWTSFKGPICADEIGVTLDGNTSVTFEFTDNWRSTLSENIRIGFSTTHPQGILLGLYSRLSGEYMVVSVTNSGHLRVIFDFGFERQELIYPLKNFGLGQFHDLRIRRKNMGATMVIQIDDYESKEFHFDIKESADAQFDNIQYIYVGKNDSMKDGFIGCVSRIEFDDIYPLKGFFQQDRPKNIYGNADHEDFCGVEPVTHPPEIPETRPLLNVNVDKENYLLAVMKTVLYSSLLLLLSIGTIILIGKYTANRRAHYHTQEQFGADSASDADTAVIHSKTGHVVFKKKEWFL